MRHHYITIASWPQHTRTIEETLYTLKNRLNSDSEDMHDCIW